MSLAEDVLSIGPKCGPASSTALLALLSLAPICALGVSALSFFVGGAAVNSKDRRTAPFCETSRNGHQPNLGPADSSAPPVAGPALRPGTAPPFRGPYGRRLPAQERSHPQFPSLSNPWP